MKNNAASLKAGIRALAKEEGISAQVVLQNYMFERFLERLSLSDYHEKFILKGGLLIAIMVGIQTRSTMDMDTTVRLLPLEEGIIRTAMREICAIHVEDSVTFDLLNVQAIRKDDNYGGFRVSLNGMFETITTPLSVDITAGDIITPKPVRRRIRTIFDEKKQIELWTYNTETLLAEKAETILRRGVFNSRPRDFYDVYILMKSQRYDKRVFRQALQATAIQRKTTEQIRDMSAILETIAASSELKNQWTKYQREYDYSKDISFTELLQKLKELLLQ